MNQRSMVMTALKQPQKTGSRAHHADAVDEVGVDAGQVRQRKQPTTPRQTRVIRPVTPGMSQMTPMMTRRKAHRHAAAAAVGAEVRMRRVNQMIPPTQWSRFERRADAPRTLLDFEVPRGWRPSVNDVGMVAMRDVVVPRF
jgi:hypothetical protein